MKVLIDLDSTRYNILKKDYSNGKPIPSMFINIAQGIPIPDGATNGEVLTTIFPNTKIYQSGGYTSCMFKEGVAVEDRNSEWWNAPYEREE